MSEHEARTSTDAPSSPSEAATRSTIEGLLNQFAAAIRSDERIQVAKPSDYYNTSQTHREVLLESGKRVSASRAVIGSRLRELESALAEANSTIAELHALDQVIATECAVSQALRAQLASEHDERIVNIRQIENLLADERLWREMLFLRHCGTTVGLYGDDGEMSCNACLIDFKRQSPSEINERFTVLGHAALAAVRPPESSPAAEEV